MSDYLNTNNISQTTHALFDAFAEQIMEHDLTGLLKASPHPEISNDELTRIVLKNWGKNGLMSLVPQADFTALDIQLQDPGWRHLHQGRAYRKRAPYIRPHQEGC